MYMWFAQEQAVLPAVETETSPRFCLSILTWAIQPIALSLCYSMFSAIRATTGLHGCVVHSSCLQVESSGTAAVHPVAARA